MYVLEKVTLLTCFLHARAGVMAIMRSITVVNLSSQDLSCMSISFASSSHMKEQLPTMSI